MPPTKTTNKIQKTTPTKTAITEGLTEDIDIIQAMMSLLNKATKQINDNIDRKHEELLAKLSAVEEKAKTNAEDIIHLKGTNTKLLTAIENLQTEVKDKSDKLMVLENLLDDQVNRSMRPNLIFKGLPESENEKWSDTTKSLATYLNKVNPNRSIREVEQLIDRCHRGGQRRSDAKPRTIFAKFVDWKSADQIKKEIIVFNKKNDVADITVSPQYSPKVTEQMNHALKRRKDLTNSGCTASMYVTYPGRLMSRGEGEQYFKEI